MLQFKGYKSSFFLNLFLSCIYAWYLFRTVLMNMKHTLLGAGGDGAKNYYTYLYQTLYGKGFHFDGMNYPWGEQVSFTDCEPLFSIPISYLGFSLNTNLAIFNFIHLFGYILTSILLFLFFKKQQIQPFLAAIFPILITYMAPNFFRLFGHYGLSFTFYIVATFYLLFQYLNTNKKKFLVFLSFMIFLISFIHLYNLFISILICFLFFLSYFIIEPNPIKEKFKFGIAILSSAMIGFGFVKLLFLLTDKIQDRPKTPWGMSFYVTKFLNFFSSGYSELGKVFKLIFNNFIMNDLNESYAYLGFIPILYLLFLFFNSCFYFFEKTTIKLYSSLLKTEKYLILIALFTAIISLGFPFNILPESLLDSFSLLKQFRSLGRVSLVTYFALSIACTLRINYVIQVFIKKNDYKVVFYFLFPILFLWSMELFFFSKYIQPIVDQSENNYQTFFHRDKLNQNQDISILPDTSYQCILGFPFFNIGSEKIGTDVESALAEELFFISLQKKLPIADVMMSRTSWSQVFEKIKLSGGVFTDNTQFSQSLNAQKILIVAYKNAPINQGEREIISQSKFLNENENFVFYQLDWNQWIAYKSSIIDSLNKKTIQEINTNKQFFVSQTFDNTNTSTKLFGSGALNVAKLDSCILFDTTIHITQPIMYELSLWALVDSVSYFMPYSTLYFFDKQNKLLSSKDALFRKANDHNGFWFRAFSEFEMDSTINSIKLILYNRDQGKSAYYIDQILLKPLSQIYAQEDSQNRRMYNNHLIH